MEVPPLEVTIGDVNERVGIRVTLGGAVVLDAPAEMARKVVDSKGVVDPTLFGADEWLPELKVITM